MQVSFSCLLLHSSQKIRWSPDTTSTCLNPSSWNFYHALSSLFCTFTGRSNMFSWLFLPPPSLFHQIPGRSTHAYFPSVQTGLVLVQWRLNHSGSKRSWEAHIFQYCAELCAAQYGPVIEEGRERGALYWWAGCCCCCFCSPSTGFCKDLYLSSCRYQGGERQRA